MAITQAMLDAERDRLTDELFPDTPEASVVRGSHRVGWNDCLAFLRKHGEIMQSVVATNPDGVVWGEPFVRVEIPAE